MKKVRRRPPLLRALGTQDPPQVIQVAARQFRRQDIFKHDSWAATALYADPSGDRIVCKFNRQQPVLLIPMAWLGRWLGRHEAEVLRLLADMDAVPQDAGAVVVDGVPAAHAVARIFIDGAPLYKGQPVDDEFFPKLWTILNEIHARGIVYNDLHKKENVIVGRDGRPYLIDFQVSLIFSRERLAKGGFLAKLFRQLADIDLFHVAKHMNDCRVDQLTADPEAHARFVDPPGLLTIHRRVARPLRAARRRLLVWMSVRSGRGHAETEVEPEDAVRRALERNAK